MLKNRINTAPQPQSVVHMTPASNQTFMYQQVGQNSIANFTPMNAGTSTPGPQMMLLPNDGSTSNITHSLDTTVGGYQSVPQLTHSASGGLNRVVYVPQVGYQPITPGSNVSPGANGPMTPSPASITPGAQYRIHPYQVPANASSVNVSPLLDLNAGVSPGPLSTVPMVLNSIPGQPTTILNAAGQPTVHYSSPSNFYPSSYMEQRIPVFIEL